MIKKAKSPHKNKSKEDINPPQSRFILYVIALAVISIVLFAGAFAITELRPTRETLRSEHKVIPKEVHVAPPKTNVRIPILMYHYVEYVKDKRDTIRQTLDVVPYTFEQQIKTLRDAGYTFLTASELADILDGKMAVPNKPILLTFDDGHWDLFTDVLPILEKYHVKATAYIISGFIGGADFMSKDQLEAVIRSGLVEIGAHTVHHISLARKILPVVQFEVDHSKEDLESEYHVHVVSFAYPNGSFDEQAIQVVTDAGFRTAVSTVPGIEQSVSNRFFLFRLRPGGRTGSVLLNYLEQTVFKPW